MNHSDAGAAQPGARSYRGLSVEERISERRKRLVNVGIELYGTYGFRATSVKQVCLTAGLTERYFYESFANGEALLCETCSVIMDNLRQRALDAMSQVNASFPARVGAAAHTYFSALRESPAIGRIILFEMEGVSATADAHYAQELEKSTQLFIVWFLSRVEMHTAPGLKAELLAQGMLGALYQMAKEWMRSEFELPVDVMAQHVRIIAAGICSIFPDK